MSKKIADYFNDLQKLAEINISKNYTLKRDDAREIFFYAVAEELEEAHNELRKNNAIHLEDELADVFMDYFALLHLLTRDKYIRSTESIFSRCFIKYSERYECFKLPDEGDRKKYWNKIKIKQKEELQKRHKELYGVEYEEKQKENHAFIDGQNLYAGTKHDDSSWEVDPNRFRIYLEKKYNVVKAYYYIGYKKTDSAELYKRLEQAGFIVVFKSHNKYQKSLKKGNVDSDIIFDMMRLSETKEFDKAVLVSGDGDYIKAVKHLLNKEMFEKILFPSTKGASSLYKKIKNKYYDDLSNKEVRNKICIECSRVYPS